APAVDTRPPGGSDRGRRLPPRHRLQPGGPRPAGGGDHAVRPAGRARPRRQERSRDSVTRSSPDSYHGQLRALAGNRTLLLTGVGVVVRDGAGRVLLIRRNADGLWAMPAGAMELGESIVDCAFRELREETGLQAESLTFFGMHTGGRY